MSLLFFKTWDSTLILISDYNDVNNVKTPKKREANSIHGNLPNNTRHSFTSQKTSNWVILNRYPKMMTSAYNISCLIWIMRHHLVSNWFKQNLVNKIEYSRIYFAYTENVLQQLFKLFFKLTHDPTIIKKNLPKIVIYSILFYYFTIE